MERDASAEHGSLIGEWQPIETAPRSGKIWILVSRIGGPVWTARWYVNDRYKKSKVLAAYFTDSDEDDWPSAFDDDEDFLSGQPTHWMPLPEPPK